MENPHETERLSTSAPNFLAHLEQAFGWSEREAIDALGAYMMSTEAGRALFRELASRNRSQRAA